MEKYCVYCHISPSNKKYVGISCNAKKRWRNGKGYEKNYIFYRAILKYGWDNFEHLILFDNISYEEAVEIEAKLIEDLMLTDRKFGYNLINLGRCCFSEDTREKMSKSRIGNNNSLGNKLSEETKNKISNSLKNYYLTHDQYMLGKKHKPETIEKMKNKKISEETKQKMRKHHSNVSGDNNPSAKAILQYSLNGTFIAEYSYATLAAKQLNIDLSSIIKCCRGKIKSCGGYIWAYKNYIDNNNIS